MKKINTLFTENTHNALSGLPEICPSSKSQVARAAMNIGLSMLYAANANMTKRELHLYILDCEDIDFNLDPKPLGSDDE